MLVGLAAFGWGSDGFLGSDFFETCGSEIVSLFLFSLKKKSHNTVRSVGSVVSVGSVESVGSGQSVRPVK